MEDQDRETRIDEDVEGHVHKNRNLGKDEGDDVEGHVHKNRNLGKDEGDDVEGHVHLNAVNKGVHKS
jgi:hypothetical protein